MTTAERILSITLMRQIEGNKEYANKLGVNVTGKFKDHMQNTCKTACTAILKAKK